MDHQVAAFNKLDAHLASEARAPKIGGVVYAGGEQHDRWFCASFRRQRAQGAREGLRVMLELAAPRNSKTVGGSFAASGGDSSACRRRRWYAEIILEYYELTAIQAEQVCSRNGYIHIARNLHASHLPTKMATTVHEFAGNDAVVENLSFVVNVAEKQVECGDPLRQSSGNAIPF